MTWLNTWTGPWRTSYGDGCGRWRLAYLSILIPDDGMTAWKNSTVENQVWGENSCSCYRPSNLCWLPGYNHFSFHELVRTLVRGEDNSRDVVGHFVCTDSPDVPTFYMASSHRGDGCLLMILSISYLASPQHIQGAEHSAAILNVQINTTCRSRALLN